MHVLRGATGQRRYRRALRPLAITASLALVLAACGGGGRDDDNNSASDTTTADGDGNEQPSIDTDDCVTDPTTEIEGDTIKLGTSLPQSGLYSAFTEILRGEKSYFDYINEQGGVEIAGKKFQIELVDKDDQYEAEKTVANVEGLVNDDSVFALFDVIGTKNNLAIRNFVNDNCVPNLFTGTGSPAWGNPDYPWTIGSELVPYPLEMKAFFDYLQENKPEAKVAILRAADDFGRAYVDSFKSLIEGTDITVVAEEEYNPEQFDTKAQVTSLAATDADTWILGATLLGCPDALKNAAAEGWEPLIYMSGTCTSKTLMAAASPAGDGVLSVAPVMDTNDPQFADNEQLKLYKENAAGDTTNSIVAYGWTTAALLVHTLEQASAPTRLAVMEAAHNLEASGVGLQFEGQTWITNADDPFVGESFHLVQYSNADGFFKLLGDLIDENGKTADYTPEELING
jgi:branched-chain amino acid transport system substrate-binding protein